MNTPLLVLVTLIYLGVSYSYLCHGKAPMAGVFFGYALSNCFFIWDSLGG
jgi:hypothetical protein